jgi:hypothetical protein
VIYICNPIEDGGRKIIVQTSLGRKHETLYEKITKVKKGWRHGSSDRVPV